MSLGFRYLKPLYTPCEVSYENSPRSPWHRIEAAESHLAQLRSLKELKGVAIGSFSAPERANRGPSPLPQGPSPDCFRTDLDTCANIVRSAATKQDWCSAPARQQTVFRGGGMMKINSSTYSATHSGILRSHRAIRTIFWNRLDPVRVLLR
mgnify:CR=1 FL=1